jgi:hypothetical protein
MVAARLDPNDGVVGDRVALVRKDSECSVQTYQRLDVRCVAVQLIGSLEKRDLTAQVICIASSPVLRQRKCERLGSLLQAIQCALGDRLLPGWG